MENKDLNTFMNDKLDQGNGLRYKDAYWDDMSKLLDANMPVVTPETAVSAASNITAKITATALKWLYLSTAFAAITTVSILYFKPFNPSAPVHTEKTNSTVPTTHTQEPAHNITQGPTAITPLNETPQTGESTGDIQVNTPVDNGQTSSQQNISSSVPENADYAPQTHSGNTHIRNESYNTDETNATPLMVNKSDEEIIKTHYLNFEPIGPISNNTLGNVALSENTSVYPLPSNHRSSIIKHLAIAPYVGMVFERGEQSYTSGYTVNNHPAQSNWIYGINIEGGGKHLALRTGLGLGSTTMETHTTTGENVYDVDTQYVIINPNYGTTQSGKPVALVQRQIDSSYVGTNYTTTHQHTTYQYLVVPLTLQYRITHKRLALVFEGGGLHQFLISQPNNNKPQAEENFFSLPSYSFQLTAGSSIRYALSSQWAVGAQYNYNLNPSSANPHLLNNAHQATLMLIWSIR